METHVETFNFLANLPNRTLVKQITFPSSHSNGFTKVGFMAWKFDGLNATSQEVFGLSKESAIANLETLLNAKKLGIAPNWQ